MIHYLVARSIGKIREASAESNVMVVVSAGLQRGRLVGSD